MEGNITHQLCTIKFYLKNLCGSCILLYGEAKISLAATCRPQAFHSWGPLGAARGYHRDQ